MQRSDDTAQALTKRLESYHEQTVVVKYKASVKHEARPRADQTSLASCLYLTNQ